MAWFSSSGIKDSEQHHPGHWKTLSLCVLRGQSRRGHFTGPAGVLLLPLQSELADGLVKREQFIHSQHQTFNFQINPVSCRCRMENQPHLSKHVGANLRTSCGFSLLQFVFVCVHAHMQLCVPMRALSESRERVSRACTIINKGVTSSLSHAQLCPCWGPELGSSRLHSKRS